MKKYIAAPLTVLLISVFVSPHLRGQGNLPYRYKDLSGSYYAGFQNSLKKQKPDTPAFADKKTQKKYAELWDGRRQAIINGFAENNFVFQEDILSYITGIASTIQQNNSKQVKEAPLILLDRSDIVNAYALGNNIVVINLGLFLFVQSREELALILAHEMAHNILNHSENSLKETASRLSSDEYRDSLEAVLDSKYERLSRLKKIMVGYSANRSRHSRYHEANADSLAITLLKNAKIGFDARFFLRLDSAQEVSRESLKKPVKYFFENYKLGFEDGWLRQVKGLSSRNYNFRDSSSVDADSLRTHPDCIIRFDKTKARTDHNFALTSIPGSLKESARKITLWNRIVSLDLTPALYVVFKEKENGNTDPWYDFMAGVIFTVISYADRDLNRFNAVGSRQKEYVATTYFDLQNALTRMSRVNLEKNCASFEQQLSGLSLQRYEKELSQALSQLNKETKPDRKRIAQITKEVFSNSADNPYQELFDILGKN